MNRRFALATILLVSLGALMVSQVRLAGAQEKMDPRPLTAPLTHLARDEVSPQEIQADAEFTTYTVSRGDTLWEIATRFGLAVEELIEMNKDEYPSLERNPNLIYPGWVLKVKAGSPGFSPTIEEYLSYYREAAFEHIVRLPDGRIAIVPNLAYGNGIYGRDSFYAALGLDDTSLSESFYRWFETTQNPQTGQVTSAVPFNPEDKSLEPQDDETTLLYLIWSALLHNQGVSVDMDSVAKAYKFVQTHIRDGYYFSNPGPFRYWADTLFVQGQDVVSYNQGLYVIVLEFLQPWFEQDITPEMIQQARNNYINLYNEDLGFVTQSKNTSLQDASALFPEVLHRYFFGRNIMPDDLVLKTVDHRLGTSSAYFPNGKLAGIKVISQAQGTFLPPASFSVPALANWGDYHNGAYWPVWTLSELALAYKISQDNKYVQIIEQLLEVELGEDSRSKEFVRLSPGLLGSFDSSRSSHSWNACFIAVAKWAGILR